jgi:hypothetical protein
VVKEKFESGLTTIECDDLRDGLQHSFESQPVPIVIIGDDYGRLPYRTVQRVHLVFVRSAGLQVRFIYVVVLAGARRHRRQIRSTPDSGKIRCGNYS